MKKGPKFFVKTDDGHTNEAIARIVPETNFSEEKKAWRCDFDTVLSLLRSIPQAVLKFKVFIDFGDDKLHLFKIQPAKRFQTVVSQMKTKLAILQHDWEKKNVA